MGRATIPEKSQLFCSVLYHPDVHLDQALRTLKHTFGDTVHETEPTLFTFTEYYHPEMGSPLCRAILAFSDLVERDCLPEVKSRTNMIEDDYRQEGRRMINLDPGILTLENICLATTKPYSHRLYLGRGIWAEVTLIYKGSSYQKLEWTYPDYASEALIRFFNSLREDYRRRIQCRQA